MNRTLKVIFCIFFFAVCLFFSLATFIPGASKITEGGIERPSLVKDGFINDDFGTDYEEYFSRAFAYRGYVVDLWSQTRAAIGEGNDQVVVGKDNFLFFAETIDSYTGNPMSDDEIKLAADAIENLAKTAASKGARFLFAPAPDKNTIYPEKMPARYI
ncbi:MAG: alginate O-acetyltransferase AlgX-related protein [Eubacteriales bacterium]